MKRFTRIISTVGGLILLVLSNYLITFSGIIAPYSLPVFAITFGFGIAFVALLFYSSEKTVSKMETRIEKLEKVVEELKRGAYNPRIESNNIATDTAKGV
jgi:hypothetical protein